MVHDPVVARMLESESSSPLAHGGLGVEGIQSVARAIELTVDKGAVHFRSSTPAACCRYSAASLADHVVVVASLRSAHEGGGGFEGSSPTGYRARHEGLCWLPLHALRDPHAVVGLLPALLVMSWSSTLGDMSTPERRLKSNLGRS